MANQSDTPRVAPHASTNISRSEISEGFTNILYGFDYANFQNVSASHPLGEDVPQVWNLMFDGSSYAQLIMEFEDGVIVADAPLQQSEHTIEWVRQNLKKPITHLWVSYNLVMIRDNVSRYNKSLTVVLKPSHHHRDHTGDAAKFVNIGASIIVPEMAERYWSNIPNVSLITYTYVSEVYRVKFTLARPNLKLSDERPFVYKDDKIQAWFMWREEAVHASDWSYTMVTKNCPSDDDNMVVFNADAWSPGTNAIRFDQGFARQWLDQVFDDGLSKSAM